MGSNFFCQIGDTSDLLVRTLSWGEKTLLDNWAGGGNWSSYCTVSIEALKERNSSLVNWCGNKFYPSLAVTELKKSKISIVAKQSDYSIPSNN